MTAPLPLMASLIACAGFVACYVHGSPSQALPLCVNGHPAPRSANVSYGDLAPRHGYQRDHVIPLCLGGPDTADNVRYQPLPEAKIKDEAEWRMCEMVCRGDISPSAAIKYLANGLWRQPGGYFSHPAPARDR